MKKHRNVYLSPHYDDAALSCGGAIHQKTRAGQAVQVITICGASPGADWPLSQFAASLHARWGNPAHVVLTRQAEDRAAMAVLGASFLRLHVTDAIYRGNADQGAWYYNDNDQLFGHIHPDDLPLAEHIAAAIEAAVRDPDDVLVYAPLAIGHHVDHQLTHVAAWVLREQGWQVAFYEDYPYVDPASPMQIHPELYGLEATLERMSQVELTPELQCFTEADLQAKSASIAEYRSQLEMLFGSRQAMENAVRSYAMQLGGSQPAERVWLPG